MGIYVKTPTGKEPLQKKVTASEIKEALGYTPADKNSVPENLDLSDVTSNDDTFYIVDKYDNVIAQIDADGIHTTTVNAKEVSLGGSLLLKEHLEDAHSTESKRHVSDEDRKRWNDNTAGKDQGIADIVDAIDASDDGKTFVIVDKDGYKIAEFDADGLHVLNVLIGNNAAGEEQKSVAQLIDEAMPSLEGYAKTSDIPSLEGYAKTNDVTQMVEDVESIAKGAQQAVSFESYQDMILEVDTLSMDTYRVGQNVLIRTLGVPDLWVYAKSTTYATYTYTSDDDIVTALKTGVIKVGYYEFAALETGKVVLTDYAKPSDLETLRAEISEEIVSEQEEFHIVDANDNIVAKIDKGGVQSVAFLDKDGNELTNLTPLFTRKTKVAGFAGEVQTDLGYSAVITLDTKCRSVENVKLLTTNGFNSQEVTISHYEGRITVTGWADSPIKGVYANISYTASHADHASSAETCASTPTIDTHIANKKYVDDEIYKFSSGANTVKIAQTADALKSGFNLNGGYGSEISVYFNAARAYVILVAYQMNNYTGIFVNVGGTQEFMLYGTADDNGIKCKYNSIASTLTFTKDGTSIAAGSCYVREL